MKGRTFILGLSLLVLLPFLSWYVFSPRIDDESMITHFFANRAKFEELRSMLASDTGLSRVDPDWVEPRDYAAIGLSDERLKKYRALISELGLSAGVSQNHWQIKTFNYAELGFFFVSAGKGYRWLPEGYPEPSRESGELVANLDSAIENYYRMLEEDKIKWDHFECYRKIEGGWYLYFGTHSIP